MSERKYKHPTVLEAVFELRFQSVKSWGISSFVEFARLAKERGYPVLKDAAQSFQLSFPIGSGGEPKMNTVASRIQTWNEDGTQLWQASPELFAANRRAPYEGWGAFLPHMLEGLEIYRRVVNPEQAEVFKMQYINRIDIDLAQNSPKEFVEFLPPEIQYADGINNFVCRTEQSFIDGAQMAVTSTRDLSATSGVGIILDILYTATKPDLEQNALIDAIQKAHARIIVAFEKSITNALRERMEPVC